MSSQSDATSTTTTLTTAGSFGSGRAIRFNVPDSLSSSTGSSECVSGRSSPETEESKQLLPLQPLPSPTKSAPASLSSIKTSAATALFCEAGRHQTGMISPGGGAGPTGVASPLLTSPRAARRGRTVSGSKAEDHLMRTSRRVVYTAGRPPWYDWDGQLKEPYIIGVCGASASGKTTVAESIIEKLDIPWVTLLSLDSFYNILTEEQHEEANRAEYNFDHPAAFDWTLLLQTLKKLREGKRVDVPVYNFTTHSREKHAKTMYGADVLIFEGIMAFSRPEILDMMDLKLFVDTDTDICLARRLKRDIVERGRDIDSVLKQYLTFVKPAYETFIGPTMRHADIVIPRGGENVVAINLIVQYIQTKLVERGFDKNRSNLLKHSHSNQPLPHSLHLLKETPQIKGIHTIIRNKEADRDEFIFYSRRLMRLLIEFAMSLLPFEPIRLDDASSGGGGAAYEGRRRCAENICGVSILRAGEAMEPALHEVVKDCKMGKILIQTNPTTKEPELHYVRLPHDIHRYRVLLMDATVATGATVMMAVRILLDHDVPEENIMLLSLLMAEVGVHSIAYAFPRLRQVTTAVDPEISKSFYILPGIGNFGDRYFGTYLNWGQDVSEDVANQSIDEDLTAALAEINFKLPPSEDEEEEED